ncbi:glycosyltransferase [Agreia pratensis]|uniref:Glycosyltransferase involved in cell wall bisynthesis n=1 Tax=Agreia pratensis TaxID=150121 RepID=A0A1X7IM41_9MICO|nr:glycosyltransferase [Agreia pratensis]SMG16063.1 Glycosyltransferase involved in cell wall bisynthesis [Agreia pratensis]
MSKRKSVSIIGTRGYPSYYGGFETAVRRIAPYLVDAGWDVTVYGRHGSTAPDDPTRDHRVVTRTTWGIEGRSVSTLTYGLTASMDAAVRRPDVALVMNVANGFYLPLLRARGIPSLVNVDGIEWDRAKWGRLAKNVFRAGARMTARFGTRMVYDSHEIGRRWRKEFGVDGVFLPYGGDTPAELPIEPGLEHRGYVLVVARFVPENTIEEFLLAAETISERWPVVIVGSSGYGGELDERARKLADDRENVHWLGHVSDDARLFSLWQHAGVYFHGHSVGGTNPALVQAMACGTAIVARDTPYNREVLGADSVLTRPVPDDIAETIMQLMLDPGRIEELSKRNQERAHSSYSWQQICAGYEQALTELMTRRSLRSAKERGEADQGAML